MKVGIFGSSFNPPHREHINICTHALSELGLDKVVLLPCGNAPHKKNILPFDTRVKMLNLSVRSKDIVIDTLENELEGVTNSARILPILSQKYSDIVFIIGGDSLEKMDTWIQPQVVMSYPIAVVPRKQITPELLAAAEKYRMSQGSQITFLSYIGEDVSSTIIRTKLELGLPCLDVAPECAEYIRQNNLYSNYRSFISVLKQRLKPLRFQHSLQVVLMAVRLNEQLGLDYDKVFTAALLHDCAKYSTRPHPEIEASFAHGPFAHAFIGAMEVQSDFDVHDEDVINAIRYHTTGRANMSKLEKLIYLADYTEATRTNPSSVLVREIALENFEKGFIACLQAMHEYLGDSKDLCPLSAECYNYYVKK